MVERNDNNKSHYDFKMLPFFLSQKQQSDNRPTFVNCLTMTNCFETNLLCASLHDYTTGPYRSTMIRGVFHSLEFERKVCRVGFKNAFGQRLPSAVSLDINFGLFDSKPTMNSSQWKKKARATTKMNRNNYAFSPDDTLKQRRITHDLRFQTDCYHTTPTFHGENKTLINSRLSVSNGPKSMDKQLLKCGVMAHCSDWVLEGLINQIQKKRSVRAVLYQCIRDVGSLLDHLRSACPVLGVRITASGRLGKQKKAMAKQLTLSVGKVPNGTFGQKVGYSQGFVVTKFGLVGLKVTMAFR